MSKNGNAVDVIKKINANPIIGGQNAIHIQLRENNNIQNNNGEEEENIELTEK